MERDDLDVARAIGNEVRHGRFRAGLSQEQLGAQVGVSSQQIQKYEKGDNNISAPRLARIAEALDRPIESFYHGLASMNAMVRERPPDFDPLPTFTRQHYALMRAFSRISSPAVRARLLALAQALAADTELPPRD